jgi:hypothetical protein
VRQTVARRHLLVIVVVASMYAVGAAGAGYSLGTLSDTERGSGSVTAGTFEHAASETEVANKQVTETTSTPNDPDPDPESEFATGTTDAPVNESTTGEESKPTATRAATETEDGTEREDNETEDAEADSTD